MKRILLLFIFILGIFPCLDNHGVGLLSLNQTFAQTYTDEYGDEWTLDQLWEAVLSDAGLDNSPEYGPGDYGYIEGMTNMMDVPYDGGVAHFEFIYERDDLGYLTGDGHWDFMGYTGDNAFPEDEEDEDPGLPDYWGGSGVEMDEEYDPEDDPFYDYFYDNDYDDPSGPTQLSYNDFSPYDDPYKKDGPLTNIDDSDDATVEIENGIELSAPPIFFPVSNPILLGDTDDRNPPNGIAEDMQYGFNGDITGIDPNVLNPVLFPESRLWRAMSYLVSTCSSLDSDMKAVGAKMIRKFHDREGGQFSDPVLNSRVYSSTQFKNFMKQFGSRLREQLQITNGDIHNITPIEMGSIRPTFNGIYNRFHGLQILINDTQKTEVFLERYTTLGNIWTATVIVKIYDNFGLDLNDAVTYQDWHAGFPAWYILQHRKNYKPFETVVTVRLNISSQF